MLFKIIYTSLSLCLVFGGYSVICGLVTSKYGLLGYYANSVYWLTSIIGSLICPYVSYYGLGVKWSLILGSVTYGIYILGFNLDNLYYMFLVSFLNGFGSGLFKINLNVWLVSKVEVKDVLITTINNIPNNSEFYIGIFNTIYGLNMIYGSALALLIENLGLSLNWVLFTITMVAVLMLCFISPVKIDETHYVSLVSFKDLFFKFKHIYLLCFYQGFSTIYINSIMTLNFDTKISFILFHFLIFSIGYCITSHVIGYLALKLNNVLYCNISMCIVSGIFVISAKYLFEYHQSYYLYYMSSFTMGIGEACILYFFIVLLKDEFNENKASAFAYQRVIYALSACILQIFCSFVHFYVIVVTLNLSLILGVIIYNCHSVLEII